jgi:hypothetical protein
VRRAQRVSGIAPQEEPLRSGTRRRHDGVVTEPAERPTVVLVMFEWSVEYPLWDRSPGGLGLVDPEALGVSPSLAQRLRAWSDEHNDAPNGPENFTWPSRQAFVDWQRRGLDLAYALQNELEPDVEVLYSRTETPDLSANAETHDRWTFPFRDDAALNVVVGRGRSVRVCGYGFTVGVA